MRGAFAVALVLLLSAHTVQGWWCYGHMLVAEIARQNVPSAMQSELEKFANYLTTNGPFPKTTNFVEGSCWADDIKHSITVMEPWHFINLPYNPEKVSGVPAPRPDNVEDVTIKMYESMKYRVKDQANPWEISLALYSLAHFVGDMHQPLHCTSLFSSKFPPPEGDRGGNLFKVTFNGSVEPLHSFWDSVGGLYEDAVRPLSSAAKADVTRIASELQKNYTFPDSRTKLFNVTEWGLESYALAVNSSYANLKPDDTLGDDYIAQARNTAKSQITLAGLRLAHILSIIFPNP